MGQNKRTSWKAKTIVLLTATRATDAVTYFVFIGWKLGKRSSTKPGRSCCRCRTIFSSWISQPAIHLHKSMVLMHKFRLFFDLFHKQIHMHFESYQFFLHQSYNSSTNFIQFIFFCGSKNLGSTGWARQKWTKTVLGPSWTLFLAFLDFLGHCCISSHFPFILIILLFPFLFSYSDFALWKIFEYTKTRNSNVIRLCFCVWENW